MSCTEQIFTQIRASGNRLTPQRMAILQVLQHAGTHLTPGEVYRQAISAVPGLTEATVYRTLEFLAKHNLAQAVQLGGGKYAYETALHPHHHLVCQCCGAEVELKFETFNQVYQELAQITGYQVQATPLTILGVCPKCQEQCPGG